MDPKLINPLVLAYIGDSVFEVLVRDFLVMQKGIMKPDLLQKTAISYVSAKAQAEFMKYALEHEMLSDEEISLYKRGRNCKTSRVLKNTSAADHNSSSGFEALIGYLHLAKQDVRINELFKLFKDFAMKEDE